MLSGGGGGGGGGGERMRRIKLYCPSLPKIVVPLVAWEEEKLDIGSIARSFGIVPATLKLNGHFIGRGVDLIASSVTWKSLISFFSARGLSTGEDDAGALVVDGKLCKAGSKRSHEPQDIESGSHSITEQEVTGVSRRPHLQVINLMKKRRLCESDSGFKDGGLQVIERSCLGFKRKQSPEDLNHLKRLKINETNLAISPKGFRGRGHDLFGTQFACSYTSDKIKRIREDEVAVTVTAPCKKIR